MCASLPARVVAALTVCAATTSVAPNFVRPRLAAAPEAVHNAKRPTYAYASRHNPTRPAYATNELLDRYAAGEHDAAIAGVDPALTIETLRADAERWLANGDTADRASRERAAAAFVLETVWAKTRRPGHVLWNFEWSPSSTRPWDVSVSDIRAVLPAVAWGCHAISASTSTHPADALWFLASVGALQDVNAFAALIENRVRRTPPLTDELIVRELARGHLHHAQARVADEPRWTMAELLARADRDLFWQLHQRPGVLRYEPYPPQVRPRIAPGLEALTRYPSVAGEARLHVAMIELERQRWTEALAHIDRARPSLTEPFLTAVADYFSGWALEHLGQRSDAIAAYRRTLAIVPRVRNVSTLLAAQLYLAGERAEAYTVLEAALRAEPEPVDLAVQFRRSDARLVPSYFIRLREALR